MAASNDCLDPIAVAKQLKTEEDEKNLWNKMAKDLMKRHPEIAGVDAFRVAKLKYTMNKQRIFYGNGFDASEIFEFKELYSRGLIHFEEIFKYEEEIKEDVRSFNIDLQNKIQKKAFIQKTRSDKNSGNLKFQELFKWHMDTLQADFAVVKNEVDIHDDLQNINKKRNIEIDEKEVEIDGVGGNTNKENSNVLPEEKNEKKSSVNSDVEKNRLKRKGLALRSDLNEKIAKH